MELHQEEIKIELNWTEQSWESWKDWVEEVGEKEMAAVFHTEMIV